MCRFICAIKLFEQGIIFNRKPFLRSVEIYMCGADNLHTSTQTSLKYPHHPTRACYSPTSSITVVVTVPTELLAEQV